MRHLMVRIVTFTVAATVRGINGNVVVMTTRGRIAWWFSGTALDLRFTGRGFSSRPVAFT